MFWSTYQERVYRTLSTILELQVFVSANYILYLYLTHFVLMNLWHFNHVYVLRLMRKSIWVNWEGCWDDSSVLSAGGGSGDGLSDWHIAQHHHDDSDPINAVCVDQYQCGIWIEYHSHLMRHRNDWHSNENTFILSSFHAWQ